jgi:hypothetical protein
MPSMMIRIYAQFGPKNPKDVAKNQADVSIFLLKIVSKICEFLNTTTQCPYDYVTYL